MSRFCTRRPSTSSASTAPTAKKPIGSSAITNAARDVDQDVRRKRVGDEQAGDRRVERRVPGEERDHPVAESLAHLGAEGRRRCRSRAGAGRARRRRRRRRRPRRARGSRAGRRRADSRGSRSSRSASPVINEPAGGTRPAEAAGCRPARRCPDAARSATQPITRPACLVGIDVGAREVEEDDERDQRVERDHQRPPRPADRCGRPATLGCHPGAAGDRDRGDGEQDAQGGAILAEADCPGLGDSACRPSCRKRRFAYPRERLAALSPGLARARRHAISLLSSDSTSSWLDAASSQ